MIASNDSESSRSKRQVLRALGDFRDLGWRTGIFRGMAIAVLAASIVVAPVAVLRAITGWQLGYLFPLAFVVALEGVISSVRLGRPEWRDRRGMAFRLGEIVMIVLAARLAVWAFSTGWPDPARWAELLRDPTAILEGQFVVVAVLLSAVWALAISVQADFADLAIQPDEVAAQEVHEWGDSRTYLRVFRPVARSEIFHRLLTRWAWGGLPLVLFTGLSRLTINQTGRGIGRLGLQGMGLPPDVWWGLLGYFLAGLFLLSDARLGVLRGRWYNERVVVSLPLLRRWHWLGFSVLVGIAALALLLPLGPVEPLARAVEWLVLSAFRAIVFLMMFLSFLLSALLYWLGISETEETPSPEEMTPPAPPSMAEVAELAWLPDWLMGAVVWLVVAALAGYLLLTFLRAYGINLGRGPAWLSWLRFWLRARRARIGGLIRSRVVAWRSRLRRGRGALSESRRGSMIRLDGSSPRARVRYFYLRAVQQAGEQGCVRPPHVTPLEYMDALSSACPDVDAEVRQLTAAFMDARYTRHDISAEQVRGVQVVWRRLMAALRRSG